MILLTSCQFAEKEKYLLSANYIGNKYIFSNLKNGTPREYDEKGYGIYSIPESGILTTKFKETYGVINKTFFYKAKNGKLIEIKGIPFQDDKTSLDHHMIYAFYGNDMTINFPKSKDTIGIQIITICKPQDFNSLNEEPFMKEIIASHIAAEDFTYEKLIKIRVKCNINRRVK
jgi:hypothetical protein